MRVFLIFVLVASVIAGVVKASRCPMCMPPDENCHPTNRQAGQTCGGECNVHGTCAEGLECAKPAKSLKEHIFSFVVTTDKPGTCMQIQDASALARFRAGGRDSSSGPCLGCPEAVGEMDEPVLEAARWGLGEVNKQRNSLYGLGLVRVVRATSQVVSGMKYTITIEAGESTCRVGEDVTESGAACAINSDKELEWHVVTIVDAPWREPRFTLLSHEIVEREKH